MKVLVVLVVLVVIGLVSQHASGVSVSEGVESVLLPCQVPWLPHVTKVVWSRVGSNPSTVHQHQDGEEHYLQNQHYSRRTSMSADALTTGDFSLTLREPNLSDSGFYICTVYRDNQRADITVPLDVKVSQHASDVSVVEGKWYVLLPCQVSWFPDFTKVVWSRYGFNPSTVHQHKEIVVLRFQNQHYSGRTSMANFASITGDFSLTLREPRLSDSGLYTCTVYKNEIEMAQITVRLQVKDPPTLQIVLLVVLLALCLYLWYKTITVSSVEVEDGALFVKLPFRTILLLPKDATVEWSRCAPEPMKVHEYRNGGNYLVRQDGFYCNRTMMQKEPLKTRDLSLTLRNPCFRDSGTYICTVHKDRDIWTQKVVRLRVKVFQEVVEIRKLATSVTLPFKTTAQLPGYATVEWTRSEPGTTKVHVYQNGQDQPEKQDHCYRGRTMMKENPLQTRDLSLTLTNLRDSDFGIYFCTVLAYGDVLWSRIVQLRERRWFNF